MKNEEKIEINLENPINEEEIKKKIRENYNNYLKDFNIIENKEKLEKEKKDILKNINYFGLVKDNDYYINNFLFKKIDDYRIEDFEKRVSNRFEKIIKIINRAKSKNKRKKIINIPIKEKEKINEENKIIDKYNGDENILIDQTNTNGKIVDYAFLFGKRNEKKLILFQMKCYSSDTSLDEIFVNKTFLKEGLSSLLINSIKLFNCKIIEWHYILIFYYNKKDDIINNVGLKTLFSCINRDIEFILFNPNEGKFYMKGNNFNLIEKECLNLITYESNLDQFSLSKLLNLIDIEKLNNTIFNEDYQKDYLKVLTKFCDELTKLNISMESLEKELNLKNLRYFCHFKIENEIVPPRRNLIFLYKKKNSDKFIAALNSFDNITYYDFEIKKNIQKVLELIDFEYGYAYVLTIEEKKVKTRTFNEVQNKGEFLIFKREPIPKFN